MKFISASELGRKLNVPHTRVNAALRDGRIKPDFQIARVKAFNLERVPEIAQTLAVEVVH